MGDRRAWSAIVARAVLLIYHLHSTSLTDTRPCGLAPLAGDNKFLAEAGMKASADVVAPGRFRYERLEANSHWMMLAEPEKVNKLLLDFLNEEK